MNDCPNADVRDLLPDLIHGRLEAEARREAEAHVAGCADCQAELALLRDLHASRRTPRVDVAGIAAAIPAYRAASRRSWVGWRTAAAITVLVAGGSSVALIQRGGSSSISPDSARPAPVVAESATPIAAQVASVPAAQPVTSPVSAPVVMKTAPAPAPAAVAASGTPVAGTHTRELAMGGGSLNDLSERQLTSLLKDIESLDAVPSVDVDNTSIAPIRPGASRDYTP